MLPHSKKGAVTMRSGCRIDPRCRQEVGLNKNVTLFIKLIKADGVANYIGDSPDHKTPTEMTDKISK